MEEERLQPDPVEATPSGGRDTWLAEMTHITYVDLDRMAKLNARHPKGRDVIEGVLAAIGNPAKWYMKVFVEAYEVYKHIDDLNPNCSIRDVDVLMRRIIGENRAFFGRAFFRGLAIRTLTVNLVPSIAGVVLMEIPLLVMSGSIASLVAGASALGIAGEHMVQRFRQRKQAEASKQAAQPTPVPPEPVSEAVPLEEEIQAEVTPARESRIGRAVRYVLNIHLGQRLAGWVGRGWERLTRFFGRGRREQRAEPTVDEEAPVEAALGRRGRLRQTFMTVIGWYRRGRRWVEGTLGRGRREQRAEITTRERGEGFGVSLLTYKKHIGGDLSKDERLSFNEYALGVKAGPRHIFEYTSGPLYGRLCNLGVAIYGAKRGYLEGRVYDFPHIEEVMRSCICEMVISEGFDIATYSQDFQRILATSGYMQEQRMSLPEVVYVNMVGNVLRAWLGNELYEDFEAGLFASEELATVESLQTGGRGYGLEIGRYEADAERPASISEELFLTVGFLRVDKEGDIATLLLDSTDTNSLYDPLYNFSQALFEMKRAYAREGDYNFGNVRTLLVDYIRALVNHEDFDLDLCSPEFRELLREREYQAEQAPRLNPENVAFVAGYVLRACLGDSLYQEFIAREANEAAVIPQPRRGLMMALTSLLNRLLGGFGRGERGDINFSLGSASLPLEDHLHEAQRIARGEKKEEEYVIGSRRRVEIFGEDSNTEVLETSLALCDRGLSRRLRRVGITQGNLGDLERRLYMLRQECSKKNPNEGAVNELLTGFSFYNIDRLVKSRRFLSACGIRGSDIALVNGLLNDSPFRRYHLAGLELLLRLIHTTVVAGSFTIESDSHRAEITFGMVTTPGIEQRGYENQDYVGARNYGQRARFVLADGVGGEPGGSYSSRFAVHRVLNSDMNVDIFDTCRVIDTKLQEDLPKASTTFECVEVRLGGDGRLVFTPYHIGDSRQYWRRQITRDHSWIQGEIEQRRRTENDRFVDERSSIISGYLGGAINMLEKLKDIILGIGQVYMLCCDGWWELLRDVDGNGVEKFAKVNITTIARKALLSSDNTSLIRLWGVSIKPK